MSGEHRAIETIYRFFKTGWGIWICIKGVIIPRSNYSGKDCIRISEGLSLVLPNKGN